MILEGLSWSGRIWRELQCTFKEFSWVATPGKLASRSTLGDAGDIVKTIDIGRFHPDIHQTGLFSLQLWISVLPSETFLCKAASCSSGILSCRSVAGKRWRMAAAPRVSRISSNPLKPPNRWHGISMYFQWLPQAALANVALYPRSSSVVSNERMDEVAIPDRCETRSTDYCLHGLLSSCRFIFRYLYQKYVWDKNEYFLV